MTDLLYCNPTFNYHHDEFNSDIACLVCDAFFRQVLALLEHVEGKSKRLFLLLDALHIALSAGLSVLVANCFACDTEHADTGVCVSILQKRITVFMW